MGDGRFVKLDKFKNCPTTGTAMTTQATTKNSLSLEDVLCSKTTMKILKTLKKFECLNTTEIARHVGSNFQVTASHLKLLEDQDILTHSNFGVRSHIFRFSESLRAKAVLRLLEAWESSTRGTK